MSGRAFRLSRLQKRPSKPYFSDAAAETRGHAVADMLAVLEQLETIPEGLRQGALELDKAYIPTRYPDAHQSGSPGE